MSEKPIIFSAEMVRAILEGRKTQTRRIIKPQTVTHSTKEGFKVESLSDFMERNKRDFELIAVACAPYQPGDILWVREDYRKFSGMLYSWQDSAYIPFDDYEGYNYKADDLHVFTSGCNPLVTLFGDTKDDMQYEVWQPLENMPRAAARLFLKVKAVRVERLNDISDADAIAEGFPGIPCDNNGHSGIRGCEDCLGSGWREPPQVDFMDYWDRLNAKKGFGWDVNPFVWVVEFEKADGSKV